MADEKQTCGRRMGEVGPWPRSENLDTWETTRWSGRAHEVWNWPWKPRVCSFCGGVHPEDAFKLLVEGWEIHTTDKCYKIYLEPPGSIQRHRALLHVLRTDGDLDRFLRTGADGAAPGWSPIPPVKLYTQHCTKEQVGALNAHARTHGCL